MKPSSQSRSPRSSAALDVGEAGACSAPRASRTAAAVGEEDVGPERAGSEPATRVRSTNEGPAERSASRPSGAVRRGLVDQRAREHVGQVRHQGHQPVVDAGVDRHRDARRPTRPGRGGARRAPAGPRAPGSGTTSRRGRGPARAKATPVRSAPHTGWPPMKRSRSAGVRAATTARLGRPRSVTRQSVRRPPARGAPGRRAAGTGAASTTASAPVGAPPRPSPRPSVIAPTASADAQGLGVGVDAAHLDAGPRAQREPQRAPHEPDADDGDRAHARGVVRRRRPPGASPGDDLAHQVDAAAHVRDPGGEGVGVQRLRARRRARSRAPGAPRR